MLVVKKKRLGAQVGVWFNFFEDCCTPWTKVCGLRVPVGSRGSWGYIFGEWGRAPFDGVKRSRGLEAHVVVGHIGRFVVLPGSSAWTRFSLEVFRSPEDPGKTTGGGFMVRWREILRLWLALPSW